MLAISPSASAARPSFQQAASPQLLLAAEQAQQAANALQMQARQAWEKVDLAEVNARSIDARADQAILGADKARKNMLSFGQGVLAASTPTPTGSASAEAAVPPITYTATAQATAPPTTAPALNGLGQRIGSLINITA